MTQIYERVRVSPRLVLFALPLPSIFAIISSSCLNSILLERTSVPLHVSLLVLGLSTHPQAEPVGQKTIRGLDLGFSVSMESLVPPQFLVKVMLLDCFFFFKTAIPLLKQMLASRVTLQAQINLLRAENVLHKCHSHLHYLFIYLRSVYLFSTILK